MLHDTKTDTIFSKLDSDEKRFFVEAMLTDKFRTVDEIVQQHSMVFSGTDKLNIDRILYTSATVNKNFLGWGDTGRYRR